MATEDSWVLTVLDVVEETDEARSIVLEPPADAAESFRY
jgi:ferredoxin-NADP reductase